MSKALQIPLDKRVETLPDIPYTISFIIRKRQQIDSLNELPEDKRPPEKMIWDGDPEEIDEFIDRVFNKKESQRFLLEFGEIEG